jgi:hypothetical protein
VAGSAPYWRRLALARRTRGAAPGSLGRNPQRQPTSDSGPRTRHLWCTATSSDGVEHPSCSGVVSPLSLVVAVHGPILGAMGSWRK